MAIFGVPKVPDVGSGLRAVLVREESIIAGMRMLLEHAGFVVEPSATLCIAAILDDGDRFAGKHVVTIVDGDDVDLEAYHRWVGAGCTVRSGRTLT